MGFLLTVLVLLESVGWAADLLLDFRQKLIWRLELSAFESEVDQQSLDSDRSSPVSALLIRDDDPARLPDEPYRVGRTTIEDAGPWVRLKSVTPSTCPGDAGQRTFVLGGSAAFGYPYRKEASFAALLDRHSSPAPNRVLNASRVGANSKDLVPIAQTILEHYSPRTLVILAGNNEWFHWRPARPGGESRETGGTSDPGATGFSDTARRWLVALSHSRAIALVTWGAVRLVGQTAKQAAPLPTRQVDGFVEHHSLQGVEHAIDNPLGPDRFDATTWPHIQEEYLDRFRNNLESIVNDATRRDVRVILLTMPFNHRLSPAWKQRQPFARSHEHHDTIERLIRSSLTSQNQGRLTEALETIREAIGLDLSSPIPHYIEATLLQALDRPEESQAAYGRSREAMVGNLGSILSINRVIREVASGSPSATLIDISEMFEEHGLETRRPFNADLIHDDCHPTPLGHALIAEQLRRVIVGEPRKR